MSVAAPLVSLVMASYNKAGLIRETVDSVLRQTYANWELLVVDDCSTDNTLTVLETSFSDDRIRIIRQAQNRGANYCRNQGIQLAAGSYIIFLDADDLLGPNCLERRLEKARQHPEAGILVFAMGVFYSKIGDAAREWQPLSKQPLQDFLQHRLPWSILQPLWKKELLVLLNGFDESFFRLQDVELHTRALLLPDMQVKQFTGQPDCYYRIDESRKNFKAAEMMRRYVQSTLQYYRKFYDLACERGIAGYLAGTLYKTYQQLLYQKKIGKINEQEFLMLEHQLFTNEIGLDLGALKRFVFRLSRLYNLLPLRLPGINWLMAKLITR